MYKEDFQIEILAMHQVVMAEFSYDEIPFQVFTQDQKGTVHMFDFGARGWQCSGVGFPNNELYSESAGFPYWAADGFVVRGTGQSVRLKTLPRKYSTIKAFFGEVKDEL